MPRTRILRIAALAIALVTPALAPLASAGDVQGDAYSCDELWVMKNQIYKAGGLCFRTTRAITYFGNGGCRFDSQAEVPISDIDRDTLRQIRLSQQRQAC